MRPIIKQIKTKKELASFLKKIKKNNIHDIYKQLKFELFITSQPQYYFNKPNKQKKAFEEYYQKLLTKKKDYQLGKWVKFPWLNQAYHLPNPNDYYKLRTIRNLFLVSESEQNTLQSKKIGIAGLSLGKGVLTSLVRYGIGSKFHLADNDIFEISNMNRADYYLTDYFQPKVTLAKQAAFQLDPYLKIKTFSNGINPENIDRFVLGTDLLIDTFDHFPMKLLLRKKAQKHKIPVISGVDLEKGIMLIVERYDTEPNLSQNIFLNNLNPKQLNKKNITKTDITNFFIDLIGKELHSKKMLESVLSVGEKLTSYPQLIIASTLFASVMTLVAEQVLLQKDIPSGRIHIDLLTLLTQKTNTK